MCGRAQFLSRDEIIEAFDIDHLGNNVMDNDEEVFTPGASVPIIVPHEEIRVLTSMHWGFSEWYNTRAETADRKSLWSESYAKRRCIFPLKSFYEGGQWFSRGTPVAGAGIWRPTFDRLECSLLTTKANEKVAPSHDRMPLFVYDNDIDKWLAGELDVTTPEDEQPTAGADVQRAQGPDHRHGRVKRVNNDIAIVEWEDGKLEGISVRELVVLSQNG